MHVAVAQAGAAAVLVAVIVLQLVGVLACQKLTKKYK